VPITTKDVIWFLAMVRCTWYNYELCYKVCHMTCGRSVVFSWYFGFLHIFHINSLFNLPFFNIFHIISLFNLLFFHIFPIFSLFNLRFFHIFHIFFPLFLMILSNQNFLLSIFVHIFQIIPHCPYLFTIQLIFLSYFPNVAVWKSTVKWNVLCRHVRGKQVTLQVIFVLPSFNMII
jgi:hypothetical protein